MRWWLLVLAGLGLHHGSASAFITSPCLPGTTQRGCSAASMVAPVVLISRPRLTQLRAGASGEWTELTDEASGNGSVSYADGFGLHAGDAVLEFTDCPVHSVYYWNQESGETSWEKPAPRDVKAAAVSGDKVSVASPEGWETMFSKLFSSVGASPEQMGMERFDRNKFPELFPATLTEFADPVAGDDEDVVLFRPLLARTSLQERALKLVYDAERDGWDARAFHDRVDRLGPGVVIARTEGGAIIGGYNPKGWVGFGEYRGSLAAFLYTWPDGDTSKRAIKLRKVGGSSLACVDEPESGPRFGADGLHIPLRGDDPVSGALGARVARCKLGPYYERREDGSNSIFAPGKIIDIILLGAVLVCTAAQILHCCADHPRTPRRASMLTQ
jgi:hypothetical protein